MRRRVFITLIGGAAAVWPLVARAQQTSNKIPLVGVLWHAASAEEEDVYLSVLVQAFHDLGYVEGKTIRLDQRFPAEDQQRFRTLAGELVPSSTGRQRHRSLAYARRPERKTLAVFEGCGSEPVACRASNGLFHAEQGGHDQGP
jgi:hypothetical protein